MDYAAFSGVIPGGGPATKTPLLAQKPFLFHYEIQTRFDFSVK